MEALKHREKAFIDNFLKHSTRVLRNGFAYLFCHPEMMFEMKCQLEKIRKLETMKINFPKAKCEHQRLVRQAYIDYILKLSRYGFRYVKYKPEAINEIAILQKIFDDYEILRAECQKQKQKEILRNRQSCESADDLIHDTSIQIKTLGDKIADIEEQMKRRQQRHAMPCQLKSSNDTLKKFNLVLEDKLDEFKAKKLLRKQQRAKKNETLHAPLQVIEIDSDNIPSEELISYENFTPQSMKDKPQAGTIERHIVIPVKSNKPVKVSPRAYFTQEPDGGNMQLDLNLRFDGGIIYQNKLVDGIRIENTLPARKPNNKIRRQV